MCWISFRCSLESSSSHRGRDSEVTGGNEEPPKVATILLTLRIENNSKFVRGKKRTIEHVESFYLDQYDATRRPNGEYELKVPYDTDEELDEAVNELLTDIASATDDRHW